MKMHGTWMRMGAGFLLGVAVMAGSLFYPRTAAMPGAAPAEAAVVPDRTGTSMTWMSLTIDGAQVTGDTTRKDRLNMIEVLSYNQSVVSPRDAGSGMATGRRQYQPLLIRKRIDKASPLLMRALAEGRPVAMTVGFYRTAPTGLEQRFYEVSLKDARVSDIKIVQDGTSAPMEEVSFTFRSITFTDLPGKTTFQDDWNAGN